MVNVLAIYKFVGYLFISVLLFHPFFIIVPKFFDNGVTPTGTFLKLITTFSNLGVILGLIASNLHELRLAHETKNMIVSAEMKLKASIIRTESRCSHYRLDYPEMDIKNWQVWLDIFKDDNGAMQFEKQPFNTWPTT